MGHGPSGASGFRTIDVEPGDGVTAEIEVKRSRFLARLVRVTTEADARAVVDDARRTHFDARHHCSAFVLGPDARTARSSDDGEPAGTAGVPMLSVLHHHELTDVVAVVTRWFGGVKLGAGGLVRAYGEAVSAAVEAAGAREVLLSRLLHIDVDAATAGHVEEELRGLGLPGGAAVVVAHTEWTDHARIHVAVPSGLEVELDAALAALSGGRLTATPYGERWVDRVRR